MEVPDHRDVEPERGRSNVVQVRVAVGDDFESVQDVGVPVLRQMIEEADQRGLLGPLIGRGTEFMEGKIGTTGDPEKDKF